MKRRRAHGGGGASNSEARKKVVEAVKKKEKVAKEVGRFFWESRWLERMKANCAKRSQRGGD